MAECTFHPRVAFQSALIDTLGNSRRNRVPGKIYKKNQDRVKQLYEKENERLIKIDFER